jgi:hypothetical protein
MAKVSLGYQEDSLGEVRLGKRKLTEQEQSVKENVMEIVQLPGWVVMHNLMMAEVEAAQRRLNAFSSTYDELRYNQGVVNGIVGVRQAFLDLAKDEEDSDV